MNWHKRMVKLDKGFAHLSQMFDKVLHLGLSPCRDGEVLQSLLSPHPQKVFTYDL